MDRRPGGQRHGWRINVYLEKNLGQLETFRPLHGRSARTGGADLFLFHHLTAVWFVDNFVRRSAKYQIEGEAELVEARDRRSNIDRSAEAILSHEYPGGLLLLSRCRRRFVARWPVGSRR